jgi:hypothetical protein
VRDTLRLSSSMTQSCTYNQPPLSTHLSRLGARPVQYASRGSTEANISPLAALERRASRVEQLIFPEPWLARPHHKQILPWDE